MNNILGNMPPVVKNLLILNVLMLILTWIGESQGIQMTHLLGSHVFTSPFFEPYQIVTHFFMHGGFMHLFFNMFGLVIFGSALEKIWGPKRFFIFYIATAVGAFFIHQFIGYIELSNLRSSLIDNGFNINEINLNLISFMEANPNMIPIFESELVNSYIQSVVTPGVGASGAIYGLVVGFAYLFPNTQLMLLFPPIPIKVKWFALFWVGVSLYYSIQNTPNDNIAHVAHLGGALVGFIIVLFWQKNKRKFY